MKEYSQYSIRLLESIGADSLTDLFEALLLEQRILFSSRNLSLLSHAVHGALALLAPFSWQHIVIPVLPTQLIEYVTSPIPFVIGIPARQMRHVDALSQKNAVEPFVHVDLDIGTVHVPESIRDSDYRIPDSIRSALFKNLSSWQSHMESSSAELTSPSMSSQSPLSSPLLSNSKRGMQISKFSSFFRSDFSVFHFSFGKNLPFV